MALTEDQKHQLNQHVAGFESATGVELVTTLLPRCDDYPELPWKAFAAGVALAATAAGLSLFTGIAMSGQVIAGSVLGSGLVFTMVSIFMPRFARLFLDPDRAEAESQQAAQSVFLKHEVFATASRTGILMLVAIFERRVVLLADRGLGERLSAGDLDEVVAAMKPALSRGDYAESFTAGIARLEVLVKSRGFGGGQLDNVLPNHIDQTETNNGM